MTLHAEWPIIVAFIIGNKIYYYSAPSIARRVPLYCVRRDFQSTMRSSAGSFSPLLSELVEALELNSLDHQRCARAPGTVTVVSKYTLGRHAGENPVARLIQT